MAAWPSDQLRCRVQSLLGTLTVLFSVLAATRIDQYASARSPLLWRVVTAIGTLGTLRLGYDGRLHTNQLQQRYGHHDPAGPPPPPYGTRDPMDGLRWSIGCLFGAQRWPGSMAAAEELDPGPLWLPLSRVLGMAVILGTLLYPLQQALLVYHVLFPCKLLDGWCRVLLRLPAGPGHPGNPGASPTKAAYWCWREAALSARPALLLLTVLAAYRVVAEVVLLAAIILRGSWRRVAAAANQDRPGQQLVLPAPWPPGHDHGRVTHAFSILQRTLTQAGAPGAHTSAWRRVRPVLRLVDHGMRSIVDSQCRVARLEAVMETPVPLADYDAAALAHQQRVCRFLLRPCSVTGQLRGLSDLAVLHVRDIDAHHLPLDHAGLWRLRSLTCGDVTVDCWVQMGHMTALTQLLLHGTLRLEEGRWPCGPWVFGPQPAALGPPANLLPNAGPVGPPALQRLEVRGDGPRQGTACCRGLIMSPPLQGILLRLPPTLTHLSLCVSIVDIFPGSGHPVLRQLEAALNRRAAAVAAATAASLELWLDRRLWPWLDIMQWQTCRKGLWWPEALGHAVAKLDRLGTLELEVVAAASSHDNYSRGMWGLMLELLRLLPQSLRRLAIHFPYSTYSCSDGRYGGGASDALNTALGAGQFRGPHPGAGRPRIPPQLPPLVDVELAIVRGTLDLEDVCLKVLLQLPSLRRLALRGCAAGLDRAKVERLQREAGLHGAAVTLEPALHAAGGGDVWAQEQADLEQQAAVAQQRAAVAQEPAAVAQQQAE